MSTEFSTEITFSELIEAFAAEGINAAVEDTGGGCATLIVDGGALQVGPGVIGEGFDTTELSYGFYTADGEEDSDAVWIEPHTSAATIAAEAAAAYRERKGEAAPATKTVKASELKRGDVVHAYQLRVRLAEVFTAPAYGQEESLKAEGHAPLVYYSTGTVLNPEEAVSNGFPNSYMGRAEDGTRTWQVQSNDRCTWAVEV
ncbi:hypothetical protein HYP71_gp036 [Arthrobacter phage KBurrousTX]|uniref:Uncharacterized protein n=1 Tax=Arthrobacter phage KBurrousTX TaxID=2315608 RepID=A0A386KBB3_9CAUD|nr:hypothetical protein HYP71_gp036 [Arthrobacter phage KBurrousTX]AYD81530.1 hypothetical protein KBurrousTX_36 [Arthrobacter phage KBurrousTX]